MRCSLWYTWLSGTGNEYYIFRFQLVSVLFSWLYIGKMFSSQLLNVAAPTDIGRKLMKRNKMDEKEMKVK